MAYSYPDPTSSARPMPKHRQSWLKQTMIHEGRLSNGHLLTHPTIGGFRRRRQGPQCADSKSDMNQARCFRSERGEGPPLNRPSRPQNRLPSSSSLALLLRTRISMRRLSGVSPECAPSVSRSLGKISYPPYIGRILSPLNSGKLVSTEVTARARASAKPALSPGTISPTLLRPAKGITGSTVAKNRTFFRWCLLRPGHEGLSN